MPMTLIQPYPILDSAIRASVTARIGCAAPVRFIKYRYGHHAAPSGYDRICDYVDAPVIRPSRSLYWLGETLLRPFALWQSKSGGHYEYSRYDCVMEMSAMQDMLRSRGRLYHFIYAEKSFQLSGAVAGRRGHRLVGTVHHPLAHQTWLFPNHDHFRAFDHLVTMDRASVAWWESITGRANVTWLPHGVDIDYYCPSRVANSDQRFRVVFAGTHERDFGALEATVGRAALLAPQVHFDLVGTNPVLASIAQRFVNATCWQRLTDDDYRRILQRAEVLFLPLVASTTCNVVLEALACGTPVITTRGGIEDYLDEDSAVVVALGDMEALVHALLVQAGAAEGRRLCRLSARRRAEAFSWQRVAEMHVALYARLAARSAG